MNDNQNDRPKPELVRVLPRERNGIIRCLDNGEVPEVGLHHLVAGRHQEIQALVSDLKRLREGESSFRIIVAPNGIGKTFLNGLAASYALEANLVVASVSLTSEHRFHGGGNGGTSLYSQLISSLRTKASGQACGIHVVLEDWLSRLQSEGQNEADPSSSLKNDLQALGTGFGQDFAKAIIAYYKGFVAEDSELQDAALRWISGGFSRRTEARKLIGVERIIVDRDVTLALKTLARFCRIAGYGGLLVLIDELGELTHLCSNSRVREAAISSIFDMMTDSLQTNTGGIGFIIAGVSESVYDEEKGLFSRPSLQSRLRHAAAGFTPGSVLIRLNPLRPEEIAQFLKNVVHVWALGDKANYLLPEEGIHLFLEKFYASQSKNAVVTPRDAVCPLIRILYQLDAKPELKWHEVIANHLAVPSRNQIAP
jgi:hypothetical protein